MMNTKVTYYDFFGYYDETFKINKTPYKPFRQNLALETLERIEKIIEKKFVYTTRVQDEYSSLNSQQLYLRLKKIATQVYLGYKASLHQKNWFTKTIGSKQSRVESSYKNICNLVENENIKFCYHFIFNKDGTFQINRTDFDEKLRYQALETLENIEKIVKEGLGYTSKNFDEYSVLSNDQLYQELKKIAYEIYIHTIDEYVNKNASIKDPVARKVFEYKCAVEKIYQSICQHVGSREFFPGSIVFNREIADHFTIPDLVKLRRVSSRDKCHIDMILQKYLKKVGVECKKSQQAIAILGTMNEQLIKRFTKGTLLHPYVSFTSKKQIDLEKTCAKFQEIPVQSICQFFSQDVVYSHVDELIDVILKIGQETLKNSTDKARWIDNSFHDEAPLIAAISAEHFKAIKFFLDQGANIELQKDNKTPLQLAAYSGKIEVVKLLLQYNANIYALNPKREMLLNENIDPAIKRLLIEHEIQLIPQKGIHPNSLAFHWACYYEWFDLADQLIGKGFDINKINLKGETPLIFAIIGNKRKAVKYLLKSGADTTIPAHKGRWSTPLHVACFYEFYEIVQLLIEYGADVQAFNADDLTPLQMTEDRRIVRALLEAEIEFCRTYRKTPHDKTLGYACCYKLNNIVRELLTFDINVNYCSNHGNTALTIAFTSKNYDIIPSLLEMRADPNAPFHDKEENTPLHLACKLGLKEIVTILLNHQADVNAKNKRGQTPLSIAMQGNYQEIIELLKKNNGVCII